MRPPKEAATKQVWKLQKCVYGLADASRFWYLRVREELMKLGAKLSRVDPGIFYWKENDKLIGVLACHVDDMIWGGTDDFKGSIIKKLKEIFHFGSEEVESFTYIGINLTQNTDFSIHINQNSYIDSISEIPLSKEQLKFKNKPLSETERTSYRSVVGQLNWISGISRPDISFSVCEASTKFTSATVADIQYVNKIVRKVKNTPSFIRFPSFNQDTLRLQLFTDASFNNLPNGGSQAGQIIFLTDSENNASPIYWNSSKIKRVARSTLAAETLSLSDGCDVVQFSNRLISEIICYNKQELEITAYTDNYSLYEASYSMKQTLEKRLLLDISALREMVARNEVKITWVEKEKQLSDILTKSGVNSTSILDILQSSKMISL
mgnify:CR=1 FL=1